MPNFIKEPKFVEGLRDELLDQIFHEKSNDLYKFQQVILHKALFCKSYFFDSMQFFELITFSSEEFQTNAYIF